MSASKRSRPATPPTQTFGLDAAPDKGISFDRTDPGILLIEGRSLAEPTEAPKTASLSRAMESALGFNVNDIASTHRMPQARAEKSPRWFVWTLAVVAWVTGLLIVAFVGP